MAGNGMAIPLVQGLAQLWHVILWSTESFLTLKDNPPLWNRSFDWPMFEPPLPELQIIYKLAPPKKYLFTWGLNMAGTVVHIQLVNSINL